MNDIIDSLLQIGIQPISAEQPAGDNIRYDDDFEFIEYELAKQGSVIDRGVVNWDKVIQSCMSVLSEKSKDLKVSCYLIRGLYEVYGMSGLKSGLEINLQLLNNFWDNVFPVKQRAKANSYEWLSSKFETIFSELSVDNIVLNDLQNCYESVCQIEQFLNEKLNKQAPALGCFRRSIHDLLEKSKAIEDSRMDAKRVAASKHKTPSEAPQNIARQAETLNQKHITDTAALSKAEISQKISGNNEIIIPKNTTEVLSDRDRNKLIRQCQDALRTLTGIDLKQSLDTPSAYAVNRFTTWMTINQLPVHKDKLTALKPVPADKRHHYNDLYLSENYQQLIPLVEHSFSRSPFWLDAHRLIYFSLDALGFTDSATQVREHLALFLRRFPELCEFKFSDQTPFADALTKQWIQSDILLDNSENTAVNALINSDESDALLLAEAKDLVSQKKIKQALQLFQNKIKIQENARQRALWKYQLASFCYEISHYQLAFFLLQEIDGFLQKYNLEYWEPELEKNVVHLLFLCIKKSDEIAESLIDTEFTAIYARLCQLDPVRAVDIK